LATRPQLRSVYAADIMPIFEKRNAPIYGEVGTLRLIVTTIKR
jgi:hypothetical protein